MDISLPAVNQNYILSTMTLVQTLSPYLAQARAVLDHSIRETELLFNAFASQIDFTAFCFLYAVLLIWLLRRFNRDAIFRPKNKELVAWQTKTKKALSTFFVSLPIIKQYVSAKFQKGLIQVEEELTKDFEKERDPTKSRKLPKQGMRADNIESRVTRWFQTEEKKMFTGKISGGVYVDSIQHCKEVNNFAAKYMYHNPLHLDTYKEVSKMEAEVLKMTNSLISKHRSYGLITSGGSESLIMSLYAYKCFYRNRTRPNIVAPNTIHAALDKGAMYFNIEVRKAKLNDKFEVDVKHMESLIDSNTICLYGSYPNYPHGIIDPVHDIAKLAKKYNLGFHIDGCLGGFVAGFLKEHEETFSLDVEGVTSVSLDQHKFGLSPKGISTVFFKTRELRHAVYFIHTEWVGAIYATPSCPGSRSGFASAGAWYALTHVGRKQYQQNAMNVEAATKTAARELAKIPGIKVIGSPALCVLAFYSDEIDPFSISNFLDKQRGWKISPTHKPNALHVSVTVANYDNVRSKLIHDVRDAVELLSREPRKETSTAAVYGASATMPSTSMGDEMLRKILSTTYK